MTNRKANIISDNIIACAFYAIIGILLLILRGSSVGILMTVIGALAIAMGIIDIVKNKETVKGIIEAIVGILLIIFGWTMANTVLLIFGIVLIVKGIMDLFQKYNQGLMAILSAIVTVIIGIMLVIARWTVLDTICIITGIIFLINAVLVLFGRKVLA